LCEEALRDTPAKRPVFGQKRARQVSAARAQGLARKVRKRLRAGRWVAHKLHCDCPCLAAARRFLRARLQLKFSARAPAACFLRADDQHLGRKRSAPAKNAPSLPRCSTSSKVSLLKLNKQAHAHQATLMASVLNCQGRSISKFQMDSAKVAFLIFS
jgi:hypothetical protein